MPEAPLPDEAASEVVGEEQGPVEEVPTDDGDAAQPSQPEEDEQLPKEQADGVESELEGMEPDAAAESSNDI